MNRYWVRLSATALMAMSLAWEFLPGTEAVPQTAAPNLEPIDVEGQPLASNVARVIQALEVLGTPLSDETRSALEAADRVRDARKIQQVLDRQVLFAVHLNPEVRVKVTRGPAPAILQQSGFTPFLVKVVNESTSTLPLRITSPQSGPVYAGVAKLSMERERQEHLRENENVNRDDRFLQVEMFSAPPMTRNLSGLKVEYALALIYSSEAGQREAIIGFDAGQGIAGGPHRDLDDVRQHQHTHRDQHQGGQTHEDMQVIRSAGDVVGDHHDKPRHHSMNAEIGEADEAPDQQLIVHGVRRAPKCAPGN